MNQTDCKHKLFVIEKATVSSLNCSIGIVRCSQCGTAIGSLYPQMPDALNAIGFKLDNLLEAIQKLPH
jgi:hypothetical protein